MFILERKLQLLRWAIPVILPNRPLSAFRFSHGPPRTFIAKPVTEDPAKLCHSIASAGPHQRALAANTLVPAWQPQFLVKSFLFIYCSAKHFCFCYRSSIEQIRISCMLTYMFCCKASILSLLFYLLRGPEKNAGFVRFTAKYLFTFRDIRTFVFSWITVKTIKETLSTQAYAIH